MCTYGVYKDQYSGEDYALPNPIANRPFESSYCYMSFAYASQCRFLLKYRQRGYMVVCRLIGLPMY